MVTALPLYHIFALTCCCLFMLRIGAKGLLIANPRDIAGFVKTLKASRFTLISGVNTLYNALANHPEFAQVNFDELRFAVSGGMATQAAVAKHWKAVTGRPIIEGYGLSETSPVATINRPDISEFSGTVGYPLSSTEVAIRDAEGHDLPIGESGEICIRGPQVMVGYWNRPDETAKVMSSDGYFRRRRHRGDAAGRAGPHRRPDEGHGPRLGLQRLPQRGGGRARDASGRARIRGCRPAGRAFRRGRDRLRGAPRSGADGRRAARLLQGEPDRLQGAQADLLPRGAAEDQCRQGAAPGALREEVASKG